MAEFSQKCKDVYFACGRVASGRSTTGAAAAEAGGAGQGRDAAPRCGPRGREQPGAVCRVQADDERFCEFLFHRTLFHRVFFVFVRIL